MLFCDAANNSFVILSTGCCGYHLSFVLNATWMVMLLLLPLLSLPHSSCHCLHPRRLCGLCKVHTNQFPFPIGFGCSMCSTRRFKCTATCAYERGKKQHHLLTVITVAVSVTGVCCAVHGKRVRRSLFTIITSNRRNRFANFPIPISIPFTSFGILLPPYNHFSSTNMKNPHSSPCIVNASVWNYVSIYIRKFEIIYHFFLLLFEQWELLNCVPNVACIVSLSHSASARCIPVPCIFCRAAFLFYDFRMLSVFVQNDSRLADISRYVSQMHFVLNNNGSIVLCAST